MKDDIVLFSRRIWRAYGKYEEPMGDLRSLWMIWEVYGESEKPIGNMRSLSGIWEAYE